MKTDTLPISSLSLDRALQPRVELNQDIINEYAEALADGVKFPPVVVFSDGETCWLADGYHRVHAHRKAGRDEIDCDIREGERREALLYSVGVNATHGLRRTNEDKRRSVLTLLQDDEWCGWSDHEIGRRCAVSHMTVGRIRKEVSLEQSASERTYTTKHGTVATMNTAAIGQRSTEEKEEPAKMPTVWPWENTSEEDAFDSEEKGFYGNDEGLKPPPIPAQPEPKANHRARGTGENEWYTPAEYIERARAVLGRIDLDPASSEQAQERVKAGNFYTAEDDGLAQPWKGRVWLNPPYAQPLIAQFIDRLVRGVRSGEVTAAILLTHNYTDTSWFHQAESAASCLCFTRGRIKFESPDGERAACTQGQVFFYYGDNSDVFIEVFREIGFCR